MTESQRLLAEYVENGSESAFRELVTRYVDLVYSAAVRLVEGDAHQAQDIAQTVFFDLARMAPRLSSRVLLGGWLHRHTCYVAATMMRGERRRRAREKEAVAMSTLQTESKLAHAAPILDEAINGLGADDRQAILLRYFEQRDFRAVGEALGSNEDAARMRVNRALEKLEKHLKRQGVTYSAAALGAALGCEAVTAAPAGLAAGISTTALTGAAAGGGAAMTFLKIISMTNLKLAFAGAVVVAGIATPIVFQQQANARTQVEVSALQEQARGLDALRAENERLRKLKLDAEELDGLRAESAELARLRAQAATAAEQVKQLGLVKADVARLRAEQAAARNPRSTAKRLAPGEIPKVVVPRESWTFAGYATPEAALQSVFWSMDKGDKQSILAGVGGDLLKQIQSDIEDRTDAQIYEKAQRELKDMKGIGVIGKEMVSEDEALISVFISKDNGGEQDQWTMNRIAGNWLLTKTKKN